MPAFVKTPRFIISAIFVIWLIAVIWDNHAEPPVNVWYGPFLHSEVRLIWILVSAATFGAHICADEPKPCVRSRGSLPESASPCTS